VPLLSRGMDIDSLRCFDAVATTLRFRTAAARVHLSPAALSDRIRRLEEDLGARVLNRTTRTVALTDAGQRLLPLTRGVLGLIDRMSSAASGGAALPARYELTVGIRQEEGLDWLCPILDRLAPQSFGWTHDTEGPDDMPAHVKTMLTSASLQIPVLNGEMALGTWQAIYLIEHRSRPHRREIVLQFIGASK